MCDFGHVTYPWDLTLTILNFSSFCMFQALPFTVLIKAIQIYVMFLEILWSLTAQSVYLFLGFSLCWYHPYSQIMSIQHGSLPSRSIIIFHLGRPVKIIVSSTVICVLYLYFSSQNLVDVPIRMTLFAYCCCSKVPESQ